MWCGFITKEDARASSQKLWIDSRGDRVLPFAEQDFCFLSPFSAATHTIALRDWGALQFRFGRHVEAAGGRNKKSCCASRSLLTKVQFHPITCMCKVSIAFISSSTYFSGDSPLWQAADQWLMRLWYPHRFVQPNIDRAGHNFAEESTMHFLTEISPYIFHIQRHGACFSLMQFWAAKDWKRII